MEIFFKESWKRLYQMMTLLDIFIEVLTSETAFLETSLP